MYKKPIETSQKPGQPSTLSCRLAMSCLAPLM